MMMIPAKTANTIKLPMFFLLSNVFVDDALNLHDLGEEFQLHVPSFFQPYHEPQRHDDRETELRDELRYVI